MKSFISGDFKYKVAKLKSLKYIEIRRTNAFVDLLFFVKKENIQAFNESSHKLMTADFCFDLKDNKWLKQRTDIEPLTPIEKILYGS